MSEVAEILWEAAAKVERLGAVTWPKPHETCATFAIAGAKGSFQHGSEARRILLDAIGTSKGNIYSIALAEWNDRQPSRAVVAAAMRDAAYLAEWAGPHLLKPKP